MSCYSLFHLAGKCIQAVSMFVCI